MSFVASWKFFVLSCALAGGVALGLMTPEPRRACPYAAQPPPSECGARSHANLQARYTFAMRQAERARMEAELAAIRARAAAERAHHDLQTRRIYICPPGQPHC